MTSETKWVDRAEVLIKCFSEVSLQGLLMVTKPELNSDDILIDLATKFATSDDHMADWAQSRQLLVSLTAIFIKVHETPDKEKTPAQFELLKRTRAACCRVGDIRYIIAKTKR